MQQGAREGNKAAGPVGGVLGGAIGGVVGVVTGVAGALGGTSEPSAGQTRQGNSRATKSNPSRASKAKQVTVLTQEGEPQLTAEQIVTNNDADIERIKKELNLTPEQEKAATIAKMDDVKQMVLAMRMFANDNQDQLPGTLEQAMTNYGGNLTRTNEFELVYRGAVGALTNPDSTILVRETQAHQALSGNWIKTYGFADGHVEVHTEPDGNFEPWERQHMIAPPTAPPIQYFTPAPA